MLRTNETTDRYLTVPTDIEDTQQFSNGYSAIVQTRRMENVDPQLPLQSLSIAKDNVLSDVSEFKRKELTSHIWIDKFDRGSIGAVFTFSKVS